MTEICKFYNENTCAGKAGELAAPTACMGLKADCSMLDIYQAVTTINREKLVIELAALSRTAAFLTEQLGSVNSRIAEINKDLVDNGVDKAVSNVIGLGLKRNGEPKK